MTQRAVLFLIALSASAASLAQDFRYERLWPALQQPWYYVTTRGVAVDPDDNIFVVDSFNHRIHRYSRNGQLTFRFGTEGADPGQLLFPISMAADAEGNLYVAETDTGDFRRIQKFDPSGNSILSWGEFGSGPGQFGIGTPQDNGLSPFDIEVGPSGNIWVSGSGRVQQFDPQGNFLSAVPPFSAPAFELVVGFDVAPNGELFLLASGPGGSIKVYDQSGNLLRSFGTDGFNPGELGLANDIEIGPDGRIYVADAGNSKIVRYEANETDLIEWGEFGTEPGQFQVVWRIDFDSEGLVYAVDAADDDFGMHRVQKFTPDGQFLHEWTAASTSDGRFNNPVALDTDSQNRIYVADFNNDRVSVFSPDGAFLFDFGGSGTGPGQMRFPGAVVVAPDGRVYVAEFFDGRIQRFTADGTFDNASAGGLSFASSVTADRDGAIYLTNSGTDQVIKYDADLNEVTRWGGHTECFDPNGNPLTCTDGQFNDPRSITVDSSGANDEILVGDYFNLRIQRFDTNGNFLSKISTEFFPTQIESTAEGILLLPFSDSRTDTGHFFTLLDENDGTELGFWGDFGSNAGQLNTPQGIARGANGTVYVADSLNHRVVSFVDATQSDLKKAVVVAGGGPFPGNILWPATQLNANFSYRALTQQGFTRDTIQFLSADQDLDLDGNGIADDVDGDATNANLQDAITNWAADADEVVIYLVDHGGDQTFRMAGDELLDAATLGGWVDSLQGSIPGRITVVYDACQSGSFQSALASGSNRVVMTSAAADQVAFFVDGGALSFSNHFWTQVFNGASVGDAYSTARTITEASFPNQTPLLDSNGDGSFNATADLDAVAAQFIGNGSAGVGERPVIGSVSANQVVSSGNSASLFADGVSDSDGIARVWAVIRPPGGVTPRSASDPVRELPRLDLVFTDQGRSRWEGTFDGFASAGIYTVTFNAIDSIGNRAVPQVSTVEVLSPLSRRAIIIDNITDPDVTKGVDNASLPTYLALRAQDYGDDSITYLAPTASDGVDGTPTRSGFQGALNAAAADLVQDLTVVVMGQPDDNGDLQLSDGTFSATDLQGFLKPAADAIPGMVTFVYDGGNSGSYIEPLADPTSDNLILIASAAADQPVDFPAGGKLSFTQAFWEQVELGASVEQAFAAAVDFLKASPSPQVPQLEDNLNGKANDGTDGDASKAYSIGAGIVVAGDAPLIGRVSGVQSLNGASSASIDVDRITTTGSIDRVLALISPPGLFDTAQIGTTKPVLQLLEDQGNGVFRLTFDGFDTEGEYVIAFYAVDDAGKVSRPVSTRVIQQAGNPTEGFQVNAGISGAWFDPTHDGEGWLIQVLDDSTALIYWFTYGPNGEGDDRQVWIGAQPGRIEGSNIIIENIVTTAGPNFGDGFDPGALGVFPWGDVTFHFEDCGSGEMYYTGPDSFGQGRLNLVRLTNLLGTDCAAGAKTTAAKGDGTVDGRMSGAWFDPTHNGEGWLLEILPNDQALSVWFTYDAQGRQAWLIAGGAVQGNAIQFDTVQRPLGAFFGSTFDPGAVDRTNWGSMRFEFSDCDAGTMSYDSSDPDFGSGSLNLTVLTKIQGLACN